MQKLIINGNVGRNPEETFTQSGKKIVSFSLGVNNQDKNKTTTWYDCRCFSEKQQDTIMTFVKKGSKLLIIGKPSVNAYKNKAGEAVGILQILINEFEFIGSKSEDKQQIQTAQSTEPYPNASQLEPGSIPF